MPRRTRNDRYVVLINLRCDLIAVCQCLVFVVDCTAIPGVSSVQCVLGQCRIGKSSFPVEEIYENRI